MRIVQWTSFCILTVISLHLSADEEDYSEEHSSSEQMDHLHTDITPQTTISGVEESSGPVGFGMTLEYLIMQSLNENLVLASQKQVENSPGSSQNVEVIQEMIYPNRTWRPGFRLGFNWDTLYDEWNLTSNWTYYYNKSVTNHAAPDMFIGSGNTSEGLNPYWVFPVRFGTGSFENPSQSLGLYQNMNSTWQLNYNMLQMELERSIACSESLKLLPHFGLQTGWIHQKAVIYYTRNFASTTHSNAYANTMAELNNKFWGMGMCSGLDIQWDLGYGLGICSKFAGALLIGRTTARNIQSIDQSNEQSHEYLRAANSTFRQNQVAPGIKAALGLCWSMAFGKSRNFYLSSSWETNYWWGQYSFVQPVSYSSGANLNFTQENKLAYPTADKALQIEEVVTQATLEF